MIALLNNCLVAKTLRAIFIHPYCLYSDVTATLNQLPVQEIPGPVETKSLDPFQRSDWVKGLTRETIRTSRETWCHWCMQFYMRMLTMKLVMVVITPRASEQGGVGYLPWLRETRCWHR